MIYDLFFQNNGSKQIYQVLGVVDVAASPYYLSFEGLDLPEDMPDGEYTYVIFANCRKDVVYDLNAVLIKSVAKVDGVKYEFSDMKPLVGLMRMGDIDEELIYSEKDKNNDSNKWFYQG